MNENALCFCPHCGEDLRAISDATSAPAAASPIAAPPRKVVQYREVLNQEIEAIWGMTPLPAGMRPLGVVTDGVSEVPQALACASNVNDDLWECVKGKTTLLDLAAAPVNPTVTVPAHVCNVMSPTARESAGDAAYGSKGR